MALLFVNVKGLDNFLTVDGAYVHTLRTCFAQHHMPTWVKHHTAWSLHANDTQKVVIIICRLAGVATAAAAATARGGS